jgi:putative tryptophan/tyrosine transport system substrate-binding protein
VRRHALIGLLDGAAAALLALWALIIDLAALHRLPATYGIPARPAEGGLMYYCVDIVDSYRQAVAYVDWILRGEKPADFAVQQPTKPLLGVNAKTAAALGLTIPRALQVAADEVIE